MAIHKNDCNFLFHFTESPTKTLCLRQYDLAQILSNYYILIEFPNEIFHSSYEEIKYYQFLIG